MNPPYVTNPQHLRIFRTDPPKRISWAKFCIALAFLLQATSVHAQGLEVSVTPIASPTWEMVDFHMFSAAAGPPPGFSGADVTIGSIIDALPELPPYDSALADSLATNGFEDRTVFLPGEVDGDPNAVWFVFSVVPNGETIGSSPDFVSGPIIPRELLPIESNYEFSRDGEVVDAIGFPLGRLTDGDGLDGESVSYIFTAWPPQLWPDGTPLDGDFVVSGSLLDTSGAGYNFSSPLRVVPEPSNLLLIAIGLVSSTLGRRRRHR